MILEPATDEYKVVMVPLDLIYSDDEFNCRGQISPLDVNDLAQGIKESGLQTPIAVQPACDVKGGLPSGKLYRIAAGHRRFKAFQVLRTQDPVKFATIPVMVKKGLTDVEVRVLNLTENLLRHDLNILQEAKSIEALHQAGLARELIANKVKMSSGWVQVRVMLLGLPEEIQTDAAAGFLNQTQIRQLHSLATVEEQYAAVKKIKEAKLRGDKVENVGKKRKTSITVKKERKADEMTSMSELIAKSVGYGLHTRVLAWAAGYISTEELYADIAEYARHNGKTFIVPYEG